jgi:hypothetical protein
LKLSHDFSGNFNDSGDESEMKSLVECNSHAVKENMNATFDLPATPWLANPNLCGS